MLNKVIEFKNSIDRYKKYWKDMPKMYVLCSTVDDGKKHSYKHSSNSYIRPCDMSYDKYVDACKKCTGFMMKFDGAVCDVDFNEIDKNQFLLECSILGIMPQVEFIDDDNGNCIDEIDLTTGISYLEMRKQVLAKKRKKNANATK